MPSSPIAHDPFLPGPASRLPHWRSGAQTFSRRSPVVRHIVLFAIVVALGIPVWLFTYRDPYESAATTASYSDAVQDPPDRPLPFQLDSVDIVPNHLHHIPAHHGHKTPSQFKQASDDSLPESLSNAGQGTSELVPFSSEPVTFALIMWSEDSAKEGVLLIKSIMMYTSGPTHIHIICDEAARLHIESRLARVTHPAHDVSVYFIELAHQSIVDRVDREGSIWSSHSAGVIGLLKLLIHELLPDTVKKAIYVDTDTIFISDPKLMWRQFDKHKPETAFSLPSHPNLGAAEWYNADRICSCAILLNIEKLRDMRLIDSQLYRDARDGIDAMSPPAFRAMFGEPDPKTGHFEGIALGDQAYWWAIINFYPQLFEHLSYDWEITSCLVDTYLTGLGNELVTEEDEISTQLPRTKDTPHENQLIIPKMLHFNCIPGDIYFDWPGWSDPNDPLGQRWGDAVRYHRGYKWLWLNRDLDNKTKLTIEKIVNPPFFDQRFSPQTE